MISRFLCLLVTAELTCGVSLAAGPLRFRIRLNEQLIDHAVSGRLFVLMSADSTTQKVLQFAMGLNGTYIAAAEVRNWQPGQEIEFNPDECAYPHAFSEFPVGGYQFMALLDSDHNFAYAGQDDDDVFGPVIHLSNIAPSDAGVVQLTINQTTPATVLVKDSPNIKLIQLQSKLLSSFWGRPISMRAGIILPPSFGGRNARDFPVVYAIHSFGESFKGAWINGPDLLKSMAKHEVPEVVYVYLDASFPSGHHAFVNSVNNGPWGRALIEEFIPYIEKHFDLRNDSRARYLTGHSSGGWTSLWLQINYPSVFNGTWSTSPDPVTMQSFVGIDVRPGSQDNMYHTADGHPRNLIRQNGKDLVSFEEFARAERVLGPYGGQLASFEWAWSARGEDGRGLPLFDRDSGGQNSLAQISFQKFDIVRLLEQKWSVVGRHVIRKFHVWCGSEDNFHLEVPTRILCDFLATKAEGNSSNCKIVSGRDHLNLYEPSAEYPKGLQNLILHEIYETFRTGAANDKSHKHAATVQ